jgi:hypothetical protein
MTSCVLRPHSVPVSKNGRICRNAAITIATTITARMMTKFLISRPRVAAAARIAEIQTTAMGSNKLLLRQFPSLESIAAFQKFLEDDAAAKLGGSDPGMLVAQVVDTNEIIGIIKWSSPSQPEGVKLENSGVQQVPGCRRELLDHYVVLAEAAKKRSFGDKPCYRK